MKIGLPVIETVEAPLAPFVRLTALWIQLTGTWCNLECTHCLNSSGPREPWLKPLDVGSARRAIAGAERLGVKEIYFTGGEPFLHKDILSLLERSLSVAPTTVLTNGTVITETMADALAALAHAAAYSLEIRVSLDHVEPGLNDRVRGRGAWAKAVRAVRLLNDRGLLPIVTATEILSAEGAPVTGTYQRFRDFLLAHGVAKPRVKVLPVFAIGRLAEPEGACRATSTTRRAARRSSRSRKSRRPERARRIPVPRRTPAVRRSSPARGRHGCPATVAPLPRRPYFACFL